MKPLLFVAALGAGFLFGPQVMSGTNNSCHALEQTMIQKDMIQMNGLQQLVMANSQGNMARQAMADEFQGHPTAVTCAGTWWLAQMN